MGLHDGRGMYTWFQSLEFAQMVPFCFYYEEKEKILFFFYQVSQTSAKMCHLDGREPVVEV